MSVKLQITLPEALAADLKPAASRLKISPSQFFREAIQWRLDPFDTIRGIAGDQETDLAGRVDEILYGPKVSPHGGTRR